MSDTSCYIGVDLGTSGLRVLLINEAQETVSSAEQPYGVQHPHAGWSEQDPAHWIKALQTAFNTLRKEAPKAYQRVKAIGVSGHMHGAVLLNKQGKVLRPCILWNDTRSHLEAAALDQMPLFRERSGNIVFPGFTAPKIAWVKRNEPEVFNAITQVLLPAAYLNYWFTGHTFSDYSDSSGTSWLNVDAQNWDEELLQATSLTTENMPKLIASNEVGAALKRDVAQALSLSEDVKVVGGAGDNAAAACGIGAIRNGQGFLSLGTSGVILLARDTCTPRPETAVHTFCHALAGRWFQMGVMLAAADCLNWLASVTGQSPQNLTSALGPKLQAPQDTRFFPYLFGERTPHNDPHIRGELSHITANTTPVTLTQSVLEGVSFALRDTFETLKVAGNAPQALTVIGGGSQSSYWLSLLATVLELPLMKPAEGEFGAALGAARLALSGDTQGDPEDIMYAPEIARVIEPDRHLVPDFNRAFERFKLDYDSLKRLQNNTSATTT